MSRSLKKGPFVAYHLLKKVEKSVKIRAQITPKKRILVQNYASKKNSYAKLF